MLPQPPREPHPPTPTAATLVALIPPAAHQVVFLPFVQPRALHKHRGVPGKGGRGAWMLARSFWRVAPFRQSPAHFWAPGALTATWTAKRHTESRTIARAVRGFPQHRFSRYSSMRRARGDCVEERQRDTDLVSFATRRRSVCPVYRGRSYCTTERAHISTRNKGRKSLKVGIVTHVTLQWTVKRLFVQLPSQNRRRTARTPFPFRVPFHAARG